MKYRFYFLLSTIFTLSYVCQAQSPQERNPKVQLPDIPGYITLKGDFHMHTVFSDGHVWPSFRVYEAQRDGLDVIAITEHIDYEGYPDAVEYDREQAFEIAKERAKGTNVLVIRGIEISPRVPPYHNNAIFLENVNGFPYDYMKETHRAFVMKDDIKREELVAPFLEAQKQGGFVFYNHPGYNWWDGKDRELFTDVHQELLSKGILGGVEVVNSGKYNLIAHRLAEKYNLTMFANSDVHHDIADAYQDSHRPMTLVFAKAKTPVAIEEAVRARRTAVYFDDYLIGRQPEMEAFFKAAITITTEEKEGKNAPQLKVHITNNSDLPYKVKCTTDYIIEGVPLGKTILKPHATTSLLLHPVWEYPQTLKLTMEVGNILVSSEKSLKTEVSIDL